MECGNELLPGMKPCRNYSYIPAIACSIDLCTISSYMSGRIEIPYTSISSKLDGNGKLKFVNEQNVTMGKRRGEVEGNTQNR